MSSKNHDMLVERLRAMNITCCDQAADAIECITERLENANRQIIELQREIRSIEQQVENEPEDWFGF